MITFIVLLFLLILTNQLSANRTTLPRRNLRELPNFSKHINHRGLDLIFGYFVRQRVTLFYALCDRHDDRTEKKCTLIFEPLNREGYTRSKSKICVFNLVSKNRKIPRRFLLERYGRNQLIFVWKEGEKIARSNYDSYEMNHEYNVTESQMMAKNYETDDGYIQELLRVRIVHMNSCKFHETNVTVYEKLYRVNDREITGLNIVTYSNGAEIFFRNEKFCGRENRCRIEYDSITHKFSTYHEHELPIKHHAVMKIHSTWPRGLMNDPNRLYLVDTLINGEDGLVQIFKADGHLLEAHYYSLSVFNIDHRISAIAYSAICSQLTICWQDMSSTNLECIISKYHLQVGLNLRNKDVRLLRIRDLSNGGFLVLIGYGPEGVIDRFQQLDHVKVNSKGQIVESYGLKNFKCKNENSKVDADFFYAKNSEYCYYIKCVSPMPEGNNTAMDLDEYHWYFHGYCMPKEKEEEDCVIDYDIN